MSMNINFGKKKIEIPGIGMRIVKSAVGVFLCYVINLFRGDGGIVFYSQLAVLWCMQDNISETKSKARQRTIGTLVGAAWGLLTILGYRMLGIDGGFHEIAAGKNGAFVELVFGGAGNGLNKIALESLAYGGIISLITIFVLYTTVLLNKKDASYFSCVVFLSIVVNHITDSNPYIFVLNRVMDTMIGIILGVLVNCFSIPRRKNKDILFVSGLDDTLLSSKGKMSAYSRVELNRMIEDGAQFTISTIRTPASLMEPLRDIKLNLPVIVMDGAALYNIKEKRYEYTYIISPEKSSLIKEYLVSNEIPFFANVIIDDLLIIYYQKTNHAGYNELIKKLRTSPYRNYINRRLPGDESVVYFMVIDVEEKARDLYLRLLSEECMKDFKIVLQPSIDVQGYSMVKIYNHNATKENMIDYLKAKNNPERVVTFGTIEGRYDYIIAPGDFNRVVKLMKREYEPMGVKKRGC